MQANVLQPGDNSAPVPVCRHIGPRLAPDTQGGLPQLAPPPVTGPVAAGNGKETRHPPAQGAPRITPVCPGCRQEHPPRPPAAIPSAGEDSR